MTLLRRAPLAVLLLTACDGRITSNGSTDPGNGGGPGGRDIQYRCRPDAPPAEETPLRRLTRIQLTNTIDSLIDRFAPSAAAGIKDDLASAYARLPADQRVGTRHGGLSRLDQPLQQQLNDAVYDLAIAVGGALTASDARLGEAVGSCATDGATGNDAACLEAFVRELGARAFRQPLTDEDVAFYAAAVDGVSPAAIAELVGLLLTSPQFFYHMEYGVPGGPATGVIPLSSHELAARLSYHFWDAPPDDALWQRAERGELADPAVYAAEVERLLTDARAADTLGGFFAEWLELDLVPELDGRLGDPRFDAFVGDDVPDGELREAMIADVVAAAQDQMRRGGSFSDFLSDGRSFARHDGLAAIYRAPRWDGEREPEVAEGRVGLLTRPALLATGSSHNRPVRKGVFIRTTLLCDSVPPPPADADTTPPAATADATVRESLEQRTETSGTVCAGCHAPFINHLGYATEGFDALGRLRQVEALYDDDGNLTGERPVDTTSVPQVIPGDLTASSGAADLTALIDASGKAHSCLARDYFRFAFQRLEDELRDGCTLAGLEEQVQLDRPLSEVFAHVVMQDGFKTKRFE